MNAPDTPEYQIRRRKEAGAPYMRVAIIVNKVEIFAQLGEMSAAEIVDRVRAYLNPVPAVPFRAYVAPKPGRPKKATVRSTGFRRTTGEDEQT